MDRKPRVSARAVSLRQVCCGPRVGLPRTPVRRLVPTGAIPLPHVLTLPRLCQTAARAGPEAGSATTAQGKPCRARREPRRSGARGARGNGAGMCHRPDQAWSGGAPASLMPVWSERPGGPLSVVSEFI